MIFRAVCFIVCLPRPDLRPPSFSPEVDPSAREPDPARPNLLTSSGEANAAPTSKARSSDVQLRRQHQLLAYRAVL